MKKIGFYGAGNMAQALIAGLLAAGLYQKEEIVVYNHRYEPTLKKLVDTYQITPVLEEADLFAAAELVVLAVKPAILLKVLPNVKPLVTDQHVLVSIAAGVTLQQIEALIGARKIAHAMPNTAAAVDEAMTAVSVNQQVSTAESEEIVTLFRSLGRAKLLPEKQIDAVVGVSGSAPAYVYLFIEALADGAVSEGMARADAYEFAAQTVLGAAKMVLETGKHPGELKDAVCSPGGTTIAAVCALEKSGFRSAVINAVQTAAAKNRE